MATEVKVPALGESVSEATVAKWYKKVGEAVAADEPIVELETDKVTVDLPPWLLLFLLPEQQQRLRHLR